MPDPSVRGDEDVPREGRVAVHPVAGGVRESRRPLRGLRAPVRALLAPLGPVVPGVAAAGLGPQPVAPPGRHPEQKPDDERSPELIKLRREKQGMMSSVEALKANPLGVFRRKWDYGNDVL